MAKLKALLPSGIMGRVPPQSTYRCPTPSLIGAHKVGERLEEALQGWGQGTQLQPAESWEELVTQPATTYSEDKELATHQLS